MTIMSVEEVIAKYFEETEEPSISHFIHVHNDFIISNTPSDVSFGKYWPKLLSDSAKQLNKRLTSSKTRIDWESLRAKTYGKENEKIRSEGSSPTSDNADKSTPLSSNKRSRSSSAKDDSNPITQEILQEYKQVFESLDNKNKWDLGDGSYAEDLIYEYGANCDHEHLSHSFILGVDDPCWESVFTHQQMEIIKSEPIEALGNYNSECTKMLDELAKVIKDAKDRKMTSAATTTATASSSYSPMSIKEEEDSIDDLWKKVTDFGFLNPRTHYDEYWLQKTVLEFLDLYRWKVINWVKSDGSELDYVTRIWALLDKVFDDLMIAAKRDNGSVSTTYIDNKERSVTGIGGLARKMPTIRPDLVLFRDGVEYGTAECGKGGDGGIGKKEIIETMLHCPKIMKSMLLHVGSKCDNAEDVYRSMRIICFAQFDLRMAVSILDNPRGSVCRMRSTPKYEIPKQPSSMLMGLFPILKLALKSKVNIYFC